ncbi:carboxypeptidase regulatory-like domain-containing protein [Tundrisphaera lichenicola]|uniref:carboxypeptidase-like regulatory domain-containing protein n=1 Tax=Tundrisphaera lichenicola TaxID=2029860 RepID=UPI003EBCC0B0
MNAPLLSLILIAAIADRPDLEGRVLSDAGQPVVGAHVLIDSAGVRQGTSPLCPSCYPDCVKSATTDGEGKFRIASVDPDLTFNVLVVADGYRPTFAMKADPRKPPVEVSLAPFDPSKFDPKCILRGVVLDPEGKPMVGAKVTPKGFSTAAFSGFSPDYFDPVAVTNLRGEFVLTSKSPINSADLKVEGNAVAPRIIPGRKPERNPQELKMTRGATLSGRLVRDGKPVPGVMVGLVQASRNSDSFLGETSIGTGPDGRFEFLNVHPDEDYFVYGVMGSFQDNQAVPARSVHIGGEDAETDLGDLTVVQGHRVRGRVLLSDSKAIPPGTRLMLSREDAWDFQRVELDPEGQFEISGLPTERYSLSVFLKGYRFSEKNHSIDPQNPREFVGTIDQDIDSLKILMDPGAN